MKTIKELEEEARGLQFGAGCFKRLNELEAKLQTLKDVLKLINERVKLARKERERVHKKYPHTKLTPRLDTAIEVLEELKKEIEGK